MQKSYDELVSDLAVKFATNGNKEISAAIARSFLKDLLDSIFQGLTPQTFIVLKSIGAAGHHWLYSVDDTGTIVQPGTDLGVLTANAGFLIVQSPDGHWWKYTAGDDGMLSTVGADLGIIYGLAPALIVRSIGVEKHLWAYTAGNDGVLQLPGIDLGI